MAISDAGQRRPVRMSLPRRLRPGGLRTSALALGAVMIATGFGGVPGPSGVSPPEDEATHRSEATAWAWGDNAFGQLGNGTNQHRKVPERVGLDLLTGEKITAISGGALHSLALTSTGTVFAWGLNSSGQLGNSDNKDSKVPVRVGLDLLTGEKITAISGGALHSLALTSTGTVFAWGAGRDGQLGNGKNEDSKRPVRVGLDLLPGEELSAISGGAWHSLALTSKGTVFAWGLGKDGQLGNGTNNSSSVPVKTSLPNRTTAVAVAAGGSMLSNAWHSLALTSDGHVLAWGSNSRGQLGIPQDQKESNVPRFSQLPGGGPVSGVTGIAAGGLHSLAVTRAGGALTWGAGDSGQLGNGGKADSKVAVTPELPEGTAVTAVSGGAEHSLARTSTGEVLAWGSNSSGKLGTGTDIDSSLVPVKTALKQGTTVDQIDAGGSHSLAAPRPITPTSSTTLTASPANPEFGQAVTLTASVRCNVGTSTGTVSFFDGATRLGTAPLSGGPPATAALTVRDLAPGHHNIQAIYHGDGNCPPSTSPTTVTVGCQTISGPIREISPSPGPPAWHRGPRSPAT